MKKIIIVESPSKSKTIKSYLDNNYEVISSKGHIRDLSSRGKYGLGVDINDNFKPDYKIISSQKENIKKIKEKIKNKEVYLATDLDREGEAISWHLADTLDLEIDNVNRIIFNEITKEAIKNSLKHPRKIDMNLVLSQEARRILDRIIGFRLSSLLRNKIKSRSAGRVQSVTLRLIVDRENEINNFKPEEYWTIDAIHDYKKYKEIIKFNLIKFNNKKIKLNNINEVEKVINEINNNNFIVEKIEEKTTFRKPKEVYTTSKMQQEASTKIGFSPKKTMLIAQKLYEGINIGKELVGLITYIRTDSTRLSEKFIQEAKKYIVSNFGKEYFKKNTTNSKISKKSIQDAHEAIRPTNIDNTPEKVKQYLTNDEFKLYNLIWMKSISSLMSPAKINSLKITLNNKGYKFVTNGQNIVFDGYLKVAKSIEQFTKILLPEYKKDEEIKFNNFKIEQKQHFTLPPSRYNTSSLIKKLEEEGIGRPSTYVSIIETIQSRKYVVLKNKVFYPTDQGILTIEKLLKDFNYILDINYTSEIEKKLDKISYGELNEKEFLREFYNVFEEKLLKAYESMEKIYPKKIDKICPKCSSYLVINKGKFGEFIGCSSFPNCKHIEDIQNKDNKLDIVCPKCKKENMLLKYTKKGKVFYGCMGYPNCDFALWYEPIDSFCKECNNILVKTNKGKIICSNKECVTNKKGK